MYFIIGFSCFGNCIRVMGCCGSTDEGGRLKDSDVYAAMAAERAEYTVEIQSPPGITTTPLLVGDDLVLAKKKCTICFERYVLGEAVDLLACGHYYHLDCFDKWRKKKASEGRRTSCPDCRAGGTPPNSVNDE